MKVFSMAFHVPGVRGDLTYLSFKAPQIAVHVSFIMPDIVDRPILYEKDSDC